MLFRSVSGRRVGSPGVPRHLFADWILPGVSSADVVIHATDRDFDPVRRLPIHHHQVGPLAPTTRDVGEDRFDLDGDSWALVSISTESQGETDIVLHAIDALQYQGLPVLVTAPGAPAS